MYSSDGYRALRTSSAVIRRGDRGVIAVTGADRLDWLQGLLTNDVAALKAGDSCYSAYLTPQGRIISDMRVLNLPDRTLLEVPAVLASALTAKLDSLLFAEDAHVADVSDTLAVVDVIGPQAASAAAAVARDQRSTAVMRDHFGHIPALTLLLPVADADGVVKTMVDCGALETTLETLDVLRIETGRPLFLVDMDEHTLPLEAGIEDRAVSFTKGCYVGQEVIVRVMHRGHGRVARKLVGLLLEKNEVPRAGAPIRAGDREIGKVTSAAWSPMVERPLALGYVHRDFAAPGTTVTVDISGNDVTAAVVVLPLAGQ